MKAGELRRLIVERRVQKAWISVCVCVSVRLTHSHTERVAHEDKCSDLA